MPFDIQSGTYSDAPSMLPLDPAPAPPVQGATVPVASGPADSAPLAGSVRDLTGERLAQLAGYEADIAAAMHAGMAAENGRRDAYHADISPLGALYGDQPALPDVPAYAVPPAQSDLYPGNGDEPVPAG